jgi:hypothetical protein
MSKDTLTRLFRKPAFEAAVLLVLALLVGNVGALVDSFLHPEIPYWDEEHLVAGGLTALVCATLSFLLFRYVRRLERAQETIQLLEELLPICSNCKKIRKSGADPNASESWQPIESYITQKTSAQFSHGVCPDCMAVLYPEHGRTARRE